MRSIVDEAGEVIAKATDDHTLVGGHHRLAVAASLGKKLFWKDTGEPVKLDPFFKGKFPSTYSLMSRPRIIEEHARHWREVVEVAVDDAEQPADRFLVEIAHVLCGLPLLKVR